MELKRLLDFLKYEEHYINEQKETIKTINTLRQITMILFFLIMPMISFYIITRIGKVGYFYFLSIPFEIILLFMMRKEKNEAENNLINALRGAKE